MANTPTIFLSYSWANIDVANEIDKDFQITGITMRRDKRDVAYRNSLKEFMKTITTHDYVLVLISNEFIKSANCMYEVMELLQADDYKEKILPILLPYTNIFKPRERSEIIKYWNDKTEEVKASLAGLDPTQANSLQEDLKHYKNICEHIDRFIAYITDTNCKNYDELKSEGYKSIFELIGYKPADAEKWEWVMRIREIGDDEEHEIELEKFFQNHPNDYLGWYAKGFYYYNKKKYKLCRYAYQRSIELNPKFDRTHNNYALLLANGFSDKEAAKSHYKKALQINPDYIPAHNNYGLLLINHFSDKNGAKKHYVKALSINPDYAKAHLNYALLLKNHFNLDSKATEHYLKSIDIDPELKNSERDKLFGV